MAHCRLGLTEGLNGEMARVDPSQRLRQFSGYHFGEEAGSASESVPASSELMGHFSASSTLPLQAEEPMQVGATSPHSVPQKQKSSWRQGTCFYYISLYYVFLTYFLQTSKKSSKSSSSS